MSRRMREAQKGGHYCYHEIRLNVLSTLLMLVKVKMARFLLLDQDVPDQLFLLGDI